MSKQETTKPISGFDRYIISESGVVWDTEKQCKTPTTWNGNFLCTNLIRNDGVKVLCKIHRLVALTFVKNPLNSHNVIHLDENRTNNHYTNLYWKPKKVKEPVEKEVQKYLYNGVEYTVESISCDSGVDHKTIYHRLRSGWSVGEILRNIKDYTGAGYQTDTHWFPTKRQMDQYRITQERLELLRRREERQRKKQEWKGRKKYGVGVFVNYPIPGIIDRVMLQPYRIWDGMLSRCYNPNRDSYPNYGGSGVTVYEPWHLYQEFADWYEAQYKEEGWHIEKDILSETETPTYNPFTCVLVPPSINTFYASLPKGSPSIINRGNCFIAQSGRFGSKIVTYHKSEQEAIEQYWADKVETARLLAIEYEGRVDQRVIDKLLNFTPPQRNIASEQK